MKLIKYALPFFCVAALHANTCIPINEVDEAKTGDQLSPLESRIQDLFANHVTVPTEKLYSVYKNFIAGEYKANPNLQADWSQESLSLKLIYDGVEANGERVSGHKDYLLFQNYTYAAGNGSVTYSPFFIKVSVSYHGANSDGADMDNVITFQELCPTAPSGH